MDTRAVQVIAIPISTPHARTLSERQTQRTDRHPTGHSMAPGRQAKAD